MANASKILFRRIVFRNAFSMSIVIPLCVFYIYFLDVLSPEQIKSIVIMALIFGIVLTFLTQLLCRKHLAPLINALDKIESNSELSEDELRLAEQRGLNFPYIDAVFEIVFFFIGGLLAAIYLQFTTGLNSAEYFCIISAVTLSSAAGAMGVFYFTKLPNVLCL